MSQYRIKLKKETTGQILITYQGCSVHSILIEAKEPEKLQNGFRYLMERIPQNEKDIPASGLPMEPVSGKLVHDKISLFCRMYEQYCLSKYKISRAETGIIKGVPVTEELLKVYFETTEWWNKTKGVTNYSKNINEIRRIAQHGNKKTFPNGYSKEFASKLTTKELPQYWEHLRSLGLVPKRNPVGELIDWTKP